LDLTIRRFPNALRARGDAVTAEHLPRRPDSLGARELDRAAYDREVECDWTSGSFMFARREALESAGFLDERLFMYSEETDLCRRIRTAGWEVRHVPWMTILHYALRSAQSEHREPQRVQPDRLCAEALLSAAPAVYFGVILLRHWLRAVFAGRGEVGRHRRAANWAALEHARGPVARALWAAEQVLSAPQGAADTASGALGIS
jgi:hypothetical protein